MPAEAAVRFALHKLADVALRKASEHYDVSNQVEMLHTDLRLIQGFLKDADSRRKRNPFIKKWVNEVRDVAYRIEDVIDTFLVEIHEENCPTSSGIISRLTCLTRVLIIKNPIELDMLCEEIRKIHHTLTTIYGHTKRLRIRNILTGNEENSTAPFRPSKLFHIDVSEVVGLDSDKDQIIKHLLDRSVSRRTVLSIVGIGGLGKTTLAQKVYKSAELEGQFDCRTWLSISQKFNLTNLFRAILYSTEPQLQKRKRTVVTDEELPVELQRSLSKKKYLIILDDVWTIDLWDQLKLALPDVKNGSRVLITSRSLDVAKAADCGTKPYELPYLKENESLALLFRNAFQQHIHPDNYPLDLIEIAKRLMKKCGGLPLALIVLGRILSRRERTYSAWHKVEQTMDWHSEEGAKCSQVLAMSYEDLPCHLKPCFLYFASFPEDYKVSAKHVTRMWVAEGFVPNDGAGTMEDRAEDFLEELGQRCLVQVVEKSWNGYCKYCSMHDLLRDLAIHEAKEDNFFTLLSKEDDSSKLDSRVVRRAALQFCNPLENYNSHSTYNILRCLLFFGKYSSYHTFRLLRVLSIEGVKGIYVNYLEGLIHLRYLGFRDCNGQSRCNGRISFSSFKNLETLHFKKSKLQLIVERIDSLWELPTLRNVTFPRDNPIRGPAKWDHLKNLQTLKGVKLENIPELECNINLREIELEFDKDTNFWKQCKAVEEAWDVLKRLLRSMELLTSLAIIANAVPQPFVIDGTSGLPCHDKIQCLYLYGHWPGNFVLDIKMLPTNLAKFTLERSKIQIDPMLILEKLPSLRVLRLWKDAYMGKVLCCSMGGFPSLQKLELKGLVNLNHWDIKEGAMPRINQLKIESCYDLALPELQKISTLQDLTLSRRLHKTAQAEEHYKIKHIPSVRTEGWF